ncbi:hypothetical protein M408DRAFT_18570 [Serendipita vermifera MAFF 305830]|uniref:Cytochrome c oxidase subunit 2 n=1 Tax=Serendipita vermifera MAFF 305830 TaxID=933852 RepID=A0A0C3A794_SERVB|nr:hypothetical protein M408DRAFT_18570 [Serendipita vermifera MAFF 305830]
MCSNYLVRLNSTPSILLDAPAPWQIGFQDVASPGFEGIVSLHDSIMFYLILILVTKSGIVYKYLNHGTLIELIWTISPALVLIAIAFPSFKLLYTLDEVIDPALTVKVTGHQCYMVPESDLEEGQLRLLDVDNRLMVPVNTHIRFIVTSTDVLHDFAVPSLGIKIDATPGRLNQTSALIERTGVFYGQCSELCGV